MWSLVEHQIDNARLLANADKRRPRPASLRRAISTAYYAVFQALCEMCADTLVGWRKPWEVFTPIFRALEHHRTSYALLQPALTVSPELRRLGALYRELLDAREWADYNPEPRPGYDPAVNNTSFTRQETLKLIDSAVEALAILDRLDDDARLKLATRLVPRTRK